MMTRDATLFGLARAQRMAEEDGNAKLMYRGTVGGPTPFYLHCPLDAIEDVARGLRAEAEVRFLLARHVVVVGGDEWPLDGDLELWRRAKTYAGELNHQGLLTAIQRRGELVFQIKGEPSNGRGLPGEPGRSKALLRTRNQAAISVGPGRDTGNGIRFHDDGSLAARHTPL